MSLPEKFYHLQVSNSSSLNNSPHLQSRITEDTTSHQHFSAEQSFVSLLVDNYHVRKSTSQTKVLSYLQDFVHPYSQCSPAICACTVASLYTSIVHNITSSSCHNAGQLTLASVHAPNSYEEAIIHLEWQQTMGNEFSTVEANNTWELISLPPRKKEISSKWVFKIKHMMMVQLRGIKQDL